MTTETLDPQEALVQAEERTASLRQAIADKLGAGENFDSDAVALAGAVASHREILKKANEGALNQETSELASIFTAAIDSSKLAELLGEGVKSVYWTRTPGEGENGPMISMAINITARTTAPRKTADGSSGGRGNRKTPTFTIDGGELMTALEFVETYAPDSLKTKSLFKPDADGKRKWATKPEHLVETVEALEAAGHVVVRTEPS